MSYNYTCGIGVFTHNGDCIMRRLEQPLSGIYELVCMVTGDKYIGQSAFLYRREWSHFNDLKKGVHGNTRLQKAYNKYGKDAFSFNIILLCEPGEMTRHEQRLIDELHPAYNIRLDCVAGNPRIRLSEETRQKLSISRKGMNTGPKSEETKRKISEAKKGTRASDETRRKLSKAFMGTERAAKTHSGLIAPDGTIYSEIHNLNKFCRDHDLHRTSIIFVLNGVRPHHKGWRALCAK